MKVLVLVASCQLTTFIHTMGLNTRLEPLQDTHLAVAPAVQSSHTAASSSRTGPNNGKLLTGEVTLPQSNARKASLSSNRPISIAVDPTPNSAVGNLVSRIPKKSPRKKFDSFNRLIKEILRKLKIRKVSFSERFAENKIKYVLRDITTNRGVKQYRQMSTSDLSAAHKEIAGLGEFYKRITEETSSQEKAEIFKTSMDAFKKVPTAQILPSDCKAWLQTIAAIMGVGKEQHEPDVWMEATAQHGLLDLMTKFDRRLESNRHYHQSVESLQLLLKSRFSRVKETPGLKEKAYAIPWAIEVLYDDRRVTLNSDLTRYTEWLKSDQTLRRTIYDLTAAKSDSARAILIDSVAARAARSNKDNSSREKSAATILLSVLGCTKLEASKLFDPVPMNKEVVAAIQRKARDAMACFLPPNSGELFPNNARRVQQFRYIYEFPNELLDNENFKEVVLQSHGIDARYIKMKNEILEPQVRKDTELNNLFKYHQAYAHIRKIKLQQYMNKLKSQLMNQMTLPQFVTSIQAIAAFMKVTSKQPIDEPSELIAISELSLIMQKLSRGDPETREFLRVARHLHSFLRKRRVILRIDPPLQKNKGRS